MGCEDRGAMLQLWQAVIQSFLEVGPGSMSDAGDLLCLSRTTYV